MLRSFESSLSSQNEQAVVNSIADQLRRTQRSRYAPAYVLFWRSLFTAPRLAGVAALMMVGLGISLYLSNRQERPSLSDQPSGAQNMRSSDVRLAGPSGDLDQLPEEFRWVAVPRAKSYSVQLLEVDGTVIWYGETTENVLIAGPGLKEKMKPGKTLLWKVTALDAAGRPMASSNPGRFRITPGKRS
jgi:hypothetical protein